MDTAPETPTTEQPPTPTESPQETPQQSPTLNLDSTVQVGGENITVGDLVEKAKRGAMAEEYSGYASVLMRPDASPEDREASLRYLMHAEGYNPQQIDEYMDAVNNAQQGGEGGYDEEDVMEQNDQSDQFMQYQNDMHQRLKNVEQKQSQVGVDFLKTQLNTAVNNAMETNSSIQTLIKKSQQLNGEEGSSDRIGSIRKQLETEIIDNLRSRKSRGESFNVSWFNDAANNAAGTIYNRIRSVIGDPDKIGRSPETASETEMMFSNRQPVAEPTYEAGDSVGSIDSKVRDWNTDALSRLAMDLSSGDETKI